MRDKRPILSLLAILLIGCLASLPSGAWAGRETPEDGQRDRSDINLMFHKLGRGVSNVLLGWIEIPRNIAREWRKTDPFTGTILGSIKGVGWTVARTLAGVYEIVSFPFPVPGDYDPIMKPEFILPTVWGDRLPLFQDEYMAAAANTDAAVDYGRSTGYNTSNTTRASSMNASMSTRTY